MASIISQIFFGKKLELKSLLSKQEALQRLEANHSNPKWFEHPDFSQVFVGEVKADRFRLSRLKNIGSSIAPLLSGQVLEAASGSRIQLKIRLHPAVLIGLGLMGLLILSVGGVLIAYSKLDQLIDLIFFIPVIIILLILSIVVFMLLDESKQAEAELEELLDCV